MSYYQARDIALRLFAVAAFLAVFAIVLLFY